MSFSTYSNQLGARSFDRSINRGREGGREGGSEREHVCVHGSSRCASAICEKRLLCVLFSLGYHQAVGAHPQAVATPAAATAVATNLRPSDTTSMFTLPPPSPAYDGMVFNPSAAAASTSSSAVSRLNHTDSAKRLPLSIGWTWCRFSNPLVKASNRPARGAISRSASSSLNANQAPSKVSVVPRHRSSPFASCLPSVLMVLK